MFDHPRVMLRIIMGSTWTKATWNKNCGKQESWKRWNRKAGWIHPSAANLKQQPGIMTLFPREGTAEKENKKTIS